MKNYERMLLMREVDERFEYSKWIEQIPYLQFPADWLVQVIPPFGNGIVRFRIKKEKHKEDDWVSVYLDCYGILGGTYDEANNWIPYWEVYPYPEDCHNRCDIQDAQELLRMIEVGLKELTNE